MAYATLASLKAYLGISESGDDAILTECLDRGIAIFDGEFSFSFEAQTETRYYCRDDVDGKRLWLDAPLLALITLTNGDGEELGNATYTLRPRNRAPYWYIDLNSASYWTFDTDGEISVDGLWGYTTTAPDDAIQAVLRLTAYIYRQRDSQVFETTAIPELGVLTIPSGIPADVRKIINGLRAQYHLA
ncbi:MAG: hypothetical protein GY748_23250 [Planctomycetaceae bacterium]|nr:hypothetical protein [Planctomycetaceae bacterium]